MKNIKGCLMSTTDDWKTPSILFNHFMSKGYIDCAPFQSKDNLLVHDYDQSKLYINPPFSDLSTWVDYAIRQVKRGNKVFFLMPSRTDTKYFNKLVNTKDLLITIYFIKGRLHFNDSKNVAPFPTMLISITNSYLFSLNVFRSLTLDEFINEVKL